ncbi:MAG: thiamine pyrophosphate-binding protein [Chloroflexi bacterium]|nr:thiamine pyrophosphate-binding protein [Chloroflexota bacterium]
MAETWSGGQAVVASLAAHSVDVVFGLPGVQIMHLLDAFHGRREPRLITTRHEQGAGFMALGYARVSGRPGVALVVPGPGVLNAATAIGTAYATSTPLLLLAGQVDSRQIGRGRGLLHEVDEQTELLRTLTKWRHLVKSVEEIPEVLAEAFAQMLSGRTRPVQVEIPPDILAARAPIGALPVGMPRPSWPDPESLDKAACLLATARSPLIWAGGGAAAADAGPAVAALAERLQAPVLTTVEGKGVMPEDHPLSLGANYWGHGAAQFAAPQADVVLAVGTRMAGPMMGPGGLRSPQRLIQVDVEQEVLGREYPAEIAVRGDARLAAEGLVARVAGLEPRPDRSSEVAAMRQQAQDRLRGLAPLQWSLAESLRAVLPRQAVLVSDLTNVAYWSALAFPVPNPRCYVGSGYFGTLGFGFPTALGAKVAAPERPVVALCGDGGFLYAANELATAVQDGISVLVVVFNDGAFGASRNDQRVRFEGRYVGTGLRNPDFVRYAEAFGAWGRRCAPGELGAAVEAALAEGKPALLEVPLATLDPPFQVPPAEGWVPQSGGIRR